MQVSPAPAHPRAAKVQAEAAALWVGKASTPMLFVSSTKETGTVRRCVVGDASRGKFLFTSRPFFNGPNI